VTTILAGLTERLGMTSVKDGINSDVLQMEFYRRQDAVCHELATKLHGDTIFSRLTARFSKAYEAGQRGETEAQDSAC
jgi:hypothetical protein